MIEKSTRHDSRGRFAVLALLAIVCGLFYPLAAAAERDSLRVCADPNSLPFSNRQQEGFENQIAKLIASELGGLPVEYTWFPQRRGFIRNTLRALDEESGRHKCDLVVGVPAGFEMGLATKPYYRSTYAMVFEAGGPLGGVEAPADLAELPDEVRAGLRIAVHAGGPGAAWMARNGMHRQMVAFPSMSGDPNDYPGRLIEQELLRGQVDAVIVWGPIAGYFAKRASTKNRRFAVMPMVSEPGIQFDFAIASGVRFGEDEWRDQVADIYDRNADRIAAILREFGVPLIAAGSSNPVD